MTDKKVLTLMKVLMVIGFTMILIGHYLLSYNNLTEQMGATGYAIGGSVIAIGLILSLPTKMYLTFVFVTRERKPKGAREVAQTRPIKSDRSAVGGRN